MTTDYTYNADALTNDPYYVEEVLNTRPASYKDYGAWQTLRAIVAKKHPVVRLATNQQLRVALLQVDTTDFERHGVKFTQMSSDLPCWEASHYHHEAHVSEYRGNGRWRTKHHAVHEAYIRALCWIDGGTLHYVVHKHVGVLHAPSGYRWDVDQYGVRLVDRRDASADYHPTARQLEHPGYLNCSQIVKRLEERRATRAAVEQNRQEREAQHAEALRHGWICAQDSLSAGNCRVGTVEWCRANGFSITRHYPLRAVAQRMASPRELNAIASAAARHTRETLEGVCWLRDHILPKE